MKTTFEPTRPNPATQPPSAMRERLRDMLMEVPRHLFVPPTAWVMGADYQPHLIDNNTNPDDWWAAVHSDQTIALHTKEGVDVRSTLLPTRTVLHLLDLLDIQDHHQVLEIGTATAWTTALLAHLAGDGNLTTLAFDSQIADLTQANLRGLRLSPRSHVVNSEVGYASASPTDRIIVNFGVADIPYHWIAQCRPGGIIVLPWTPGPGHGHALRLTPIDQAHAVGTFHGPVETITHPSTWPLTGTGQPTTSRTLIDPRELLHADQGAHLTIAHLAPGITWHTTHGHEGQISLRIFDVASPSRCWATCDYRPGAHDFTVTQSGHRNLWDEVSDAYLRWCSWGRPAQHRFGLTIDQWHGHMLWLDHPDAPLD